MSDTGLQMSLERGGEASTAQGDRWAQDRLYRVLSMESWLRL